MLLVAEILGDGQAGQRHPQTRSWGLGHLAVDQCGFALRQILQIDDAGLLKLMPEIVALTRTLTHTGEHGIAAMLGRHVVDQLLNDDRLAYTRTAEQPDLAALHEGLNQIDDLDAGLEHLFTGGLLIECRRQPVNWSVLGRVHRTQLIHGLAQHVQHTAQRRTAHRHHDAGARIGRLHAAHHALGGLHGDAAHTALAEMLLHLYRDIDR